MITTINEKVIIYFYIMEGLAYIRSINNYRAPCNVVFDRDKGKHIKVPAVAKWNSITPEEALRLEAGPFAKQRHFIFLTGGKSWLFVIDIDLKKPEREDHLGKVDGVEFYECHCGPVLEPDTLITKTIGGGYHKVYQMCDELRESIKSGKLAPHVLIDVLYDNRGFVFGDGYEIVNKVRPQKPPQHVINFITINQNNNVSNSTLINSTVGNTASAQSYTPEINNVLGSDVEWKVVKINDASYKLVPGTKTCCVNTEHSHSEDAHSCLIVRKLSVTAHCFSHGKRQIEGAVSRSIRELFFEYRNQRGIMEEAVELLLSKAKSEGLVRNGGHVFKGYTSIGTYREFLQKVVANNEALRSRPRVFFDMMIFMDNFDDECFPYVERDKRYIGFSNGLLDIISGEMVDSVPHVLPRHYINQPFGTENIDTPLFDKIVKYQLEDEEIYIYLLALIGRLLYDVRQFDELDVVPFVIGETNTGKSALANIIRAMFDVRNVGTLDSKHEAIFGMASLYNKEIIIATEISAKMADQLSSDTFKNMVCGDTVSVARKHIDSISVQWKVPLFLCGNQHVSYRDDKGSVSRRLAIFKFEKHVEQVDGSLKNRIIDTELSKIIAKSLIAYRVLVGHAKTGFWNTCPNYFKYNRDDMNQDTDYIYRFLSLGPDDNVWGNRYLYFIKEPESSMLMEEFKIKFFNWLRFKHQNVRYKWNNDYSAFARKGFTVISTKICKVCRRESHKDCCKFYGHANRTTRITIANIRCIEGVNED